MIGSYINGNYRVMIFKDGTKVRISTNDIFIPERIESMDMKITNYCDMDCPMCHEKSSIKGKHADLFSPISLSILNNIPQFTEIAVGGGNPLSHPQLIEFLNFCKDKNLIPNITINLYHFINNYDFVKKIYDEKLINGIGVSIADNFIIEDSTLEKIKSVNGICHVIVGITPIATLEKMENKKMKILILGYKTFGRGEKFYASNKSFVNHMFISWKKYIEEMLKLECFDVVSFDNLALNQLDIKSYISDEEWEKMYMGDDGINGKFNSASMYVDLVENQFSKNSCAKLDERYPFAFFDYDINKAYRYLCEKYNT